MAAAVSKLSLAADTTGGRIILLLGLLTPRLRSDATHLLFVAFKLLVQCSVREEGRRGEGSMRRRQRENCLLVVHHTYKFSKVAVKHGSIHGIDIAGFLSK